MKMERAKAYLINNIVCQDFHHTSHLASSHFVGGWCVWRSRLLEQSLHVPEEVDHHDFADVEAHAHEPLADAQTRHVAEFLEGGCRSVEVCVYRGWGGG